MMCNPLVVRFRNTYRVAVLITFGLLAIRGAGFPACQADRNVYPTTEGSTRRPVANSIRIFEMDH